VPVTLRDARDSEDDRKWIRAVYRDYLSELSAGKSGIFPALGFWRRVIASQTGGKFTETRSAGEVCHRFRTLARPPVAPA
jgi:hypothetical protein